MSKPTAQARAYRIRGTKTNIVRHGKLTPRDRPTEQIATTRYEARCIRCGGPRDRHRHPVCDPCQEREQA